MKKVIEAIKNHTGIHYAIILMTTLIIAIPMAHLQISATHDGYVHILRLIGTNISLANTEFPHLIIPYFCRNFGYSMNLFYGLLVTYVPLLLKVFPISYTAALKLFAVATIFFSGIAMYRCALEITKKKPIALIASLLYMTALYRYEDIYIRFAMGEFTAFVFLPIVLQGLHNILNEDGKKAWLLGIGVTALVLTHTITTMYFAIICLLYVLLHGKKLWKKQVWKHFILQIGIAILLTAFYTIPMLEHKLVADYTIFDAKLMRTHGEWADEHAAEPMKFLDDSKYPYNIHMEIGIPVTCLLLLGIFVRKKIPKTIKDFWVIGLIISVISLFMCTSLFPWKYLPNFLCTIQYPWRMNTYFILFISIVCGINLYYLITNIKKETIAYTISGIAVLGILTNAIYYTTFYSWRDETADEEYEKSKLYNPTFSHMEINRDYLPVNAIHKQTTYLEERKDTVYVLKGSSKIRDEQKEGLTLQFTIQNGKEGDILELPYFFYLGYTVTIQTEEKQYTIPTGESPNGFLTIILPEDIKQAKVSVHYQGTVIEKAAYGISGISLIGCATYKITTSKRRKPEDEAKVERTSHTI